MKVFGVTGWKNAGKTTLTARLISYFSSRGLRVGAIKRAHCDFDIDHPNTDSYRHREAGAQEVIISSSRRWAMIHELREEREVPLAELLAHFSDKDIVLVEGYKGEAHPKIQAVRPTISMRPMNNDKAANIVALAAETPVDAADFNVDGPVLELNDIAAIAAFISDYLDLETEK